MGRQWALGFDGNASESYLHVLGIKTFLAALLPRLRELINVHVPVHTAVAQYMEMVCFDSYHCKP